MKSIRIPAICLSTCTAILFQLQTTSVLNPSHLHAADTWPQWRGPDRTAVLDPSTGFPGKLSGDNGLTLAWELQLGPSYSGPVISDGILVTTETIDAKNERVTAIKANSGEVLWTAEWEGAISVPFFAKSNGDWIRATPAISNGKVYVAGIRDVLVCLDLETGKQIWKCDFVERFKTAVPSFGFASSPLIHAGFVYVQAGEALCKLDANTGETAWRSLQGEGGMDSAFSSPIIATVRGVEQLIVQTRNDLCGVNLEDGQVYWNQPIEAFRGMNILTPTVVGNKIFTSAYGGRANLWEISRAEDEKWSITDLWDQKHQAYMSSPVLVGENMFLHLRNKRFTCINMSDGQESWVTNPMGDYWSMIAVGDKILSLASDGTLRLIQASSESYEEIDSLKTAEDSSWAHVAISDKYVYVRHLGGLKAYRF